jgi:5,5'-dehydrodivanillate O-demethylase
MTLVGPGTPCGELMRRYWHPIAGVSELEDEPTKAVRLLGEDLVLYRDRSGEYGLLGQHCPHRKASLEYGVPEEHGLRCCYHGWLFDPAGNCLEQPAEPAESSFKDRIHHTAYPVQPLGGLLWAYLGPQPAPLIPHYDMFVRDDAWRDVGVCDVPCNWLQTVENSVDLTHVDWLHQHYYDYVLERMGKTPRTDRVYNGARHVKIGFDVFPHGIVKRRIVEGGSEADDTWKYGTNPIIFPATTRLGLIRVPTDDTHTRCYFYSCYPPDDGLPVPAQDRIPVYDVPYMRPDGRFSTDWVTGQDVMVWITQQPIMDRTDEKLGASDQGIIFYRKVLLEQIDKVERGEDPLAVMRDPTENGCIDLGPASHPSRHFMESHWGQFSPIKEEVLALMERSGHRERWSARLGTGAE